MTRWVDVLDVVAGAYLEIEGVAAALQLFARFGGHPIGGAPRRTPEGREHSTAARLSRYGILT